MSFRLWFRHIFCFLIWFAYYGFNEFNASRCFTVNTANSQSELVELATFLCRIDNFYWPVRIRWLAMMGWIKSKNQFFSILGFNFFYSFQSLPRNRCFRYLMYPTEKKKIIWQGWIPFNNFLSLFDGGCSIFQKLILCYTVKEIVREWKWNGVKSAIRSASKSTATRNRKKKTKKSDRGEWVCNARDAIHFYAGKWER